MRPGRCSYSTGSFAIVPSDVYPKDKLQPDDKIVGSGHYTVASYEPGQQLVLEKNPEYGGADPAKNDRAIIQYFDKSSALKLAVEQGDVDVAYRSLSPTDLAGPGGRQRPHVSSGDRGRRSATWSSTRTCSRATTTRRSSPIRRAVAQTIDRQAIADNVYDGTVTPLYSMVPQGLQYATEAFKDEYGEAPDVNAAKQSSQKAGVKTPVTSRSGTRPRTTAPAPPTSTPRSSASSTTAASST